MEKKEQLYEGQAKKVYATDEEGYVIVSYKDDATALDGQKRGTVGGSVKLYFSLDDILKWIFSKEERNKRRNRKRDDTWRYYNAMP